MASKRLQTKNKIMHHIQKTIGIGLAALAITFAALAVNDAPTGSAQNSLVYQKVLLTGSTNYVGASAATNINVFIPLDQQKGVAFGFSFRSSAAGTDSVSLVAFPSFDGTTNGTDYAKPIVLALAGVSATAVKQVVTTNIGEAALGWYPGLLLGYMTNASGAFAATNIDIYVGVGRAKR